MTKPRFKDRHMEGCYQSGLAHHDDLYKQTGFGVTSSAYSAGYNGTRNMWLRGSMAHAYYMAGKKNARRHKTTDALPRQC